MTDSSASRPSTSFAGRLLEPEDEDTLAAIQFAYKNKSKKIITWTSKPKDTLLFDLLPPEVMEIILLYLPHDDLMTMTEVDKRCYTLAKNSKVLRCHFYERPHLMKAAAYRKVVFEAVLANQNVRSYLNTTIRFVRHLPELLASSQRSITTSTFFFGFPSRYAKLVYLLELAQKKRSWFRSHVFVVVPESEDDGKWYADNLGCAGYEAVYFPVQNSTAAFDEIAANRRKFFFIVKNLTHNFRRPSMTAIITFKKLPDSIDDYFEPHVLDPKELHTYVNITDKEQLLVAAKHVDFLEFCGKRPIVYSRPVTLRTSFYAQRNQLNGPQNFV